MMESESCVITTKNRFINQSSSLHFEQKISLNGHCDGLPPRSNNNSQINQNGANEQKKRSTSYSKRTGVIDSITSELQFDQDDCNPKDSKLPSYVGISCTISGYSNYSRYCSSIRGSYSRGSSPVMRNYEVLDGPNVVEHHFHHQHHHHNNNHLDTSTSSTQQQHQQQNHFHQRQSFISLINNNSTTTNNWPREDNGSINGGISNHTQYNKKQNNNNNGLICGDLDYQDDNKSGSSEKSLVQRRIESLYGSNVAEVWRDSRSKVKKVNKKKIEMINHRSPSCPPHALRSKECNRKSPAVFSHLNEKFLSKIDADPKNDPVNGLINSLNEVLKVNGTKPNETQSKLTVENNGYHHSESNGQNNDQYNNHPHQNNNNNGHHHMDKINGNGLTHQHLSGNDNDFDNEPIDQVDNRVNVIETLDNIKDNGDHHEEEIRQLKRGEMYLIKLEETISKLRVEIVKTEKILESESHLMNEEIIGNLLSSIGKGNLLIAQKLNQFRELCHKNINGNHFEQFATKDEDLDGFWEMVYIQVEDVLNGFQEIYKLQQNNWIILTNNNESSSSKITQPKIRSPRKVNANSKISSNQKQNSNPTTRNTARDEMRKQRLREAKLKSQSLRQEMKQLDDDIVIFASPSNGDNLLINNNGSTTQS